VPGDSDALGLVAGADNVSRNSEKLVVWIDPELKKRLEIIAIPMDERCRISSGTPLNVLLRTTLTCQHQNGVGASPMPRDGFSRITPDLFASLIREFKASDKFKSFARETQVAYSYVFRLAEHPDALGSLTTAEIDPFLVQAFLDGLSDRPGVQAKARKALQAVEKWAFRRRRITRTITFGTEVLRGDGAREPWTDEEIAIAEQHARPDLARVVTLAANLGQRAGDLCAMRWTACRIYRGRQGIDLRQQKTKKPLWIPIPAELEQAMATWDRGSLFILTKPNGSPWTRHEVSMAWNRERKRNPALELLEARKLSLHGLRASAVIRLRRAGVSRLLIADTVGMSGAMVDIYCRRSEQADNAIAALEMMERTRGERTQVIPFKKQT
jgi:integrase